MRVFPLFSIGITLIFFTSCKDISDITPESLGGEPVTGEVLRQAPRKVYPLTRTITDVEGRTIEAQILGKQGLQIAISKISGTKKYIVPLERLSKPDQDFFYNLAEGGRFGEVKAQLDKEARLAGRVARWHMDAVAAEREAAKLDLPMLMAIMINGNEESENLEQKLGFSRAFRDWASTNLVLCMLKVDDPMGNRTSSHSAVEHRNTAARYGVIIYSRPSVLLVKPDTRSGRVLPCAAFSDPESAITNLASALDQRAGWNAIESQEAPLKMRPQSSGSS